MSPTYTAPGIETIRQGEQLFAVDSSHHDFVSGHSGRSGHGLVDSPRERERERERERARPSSSSSRSDTYGRKHRSGSPQVHPYLKASPPLAVTEESAVQNASRSITITTAGSTTSGAGGSAIPGPKNSLRRYASADFSLLRDPSTGLVGVGRRGSEPNAAAREASREEKRRRFSPSPGRPTPLRSRSFHAPTGQAPETRQDEEEEQVVAKDESPRASKDVSGRAAGRGLSTGTPADALRHLEGQDAQLGNAVGDDMRTGCDGVPSFSQSSPSSSPSPSSSSSPPLWPRRDGKMLSPTARSSSSMSSSMSSSPHSIASSQTTADTELSRTAGHDVDGEDTPVGPAPPAAPARASFTSSISSSSSSTATNRRRSGDPDRYGTPEMPRGPAKLPHIPTNDLTPRVPGQSHPKHLPRAEKLPLSGYELLASTISSSAVAPAAAPARNRMSAFLDPAPTPTPSSTATSASTSTSLSAPRGRVSRRHSSASAGFFSSHSPALTAATTTTTTTTTSTTSTAIPPEEELRIKPIYRRFEALNHRLLLHLQDELSELEEQLHRLDTTDTQTRRLQSSILPASRRAEFLAGGELQWHKTDILSKIAFKLGQYNHALASFTSTRDLPAPAPAAVADYRGYLATHRPISDVETRFLDAADDLITLETPSAAVDTPNATATAHDSADARCSSPTPPTHHSSTTNNNNDSNNNNSSNMLRSLRLRDDEPIVTPIPGTMHGNSWLVRHNRLSRSSRSSSSTASSSSPGFARPLSSAVPQPLQPVAAPSSPSPSPSSSSLLRHQQQHHHYYHHSHSDNELDTANNNKNNNDTDNTDTAAGVPAHVTVHLALALAVAVLVPILSFPMVPGFVARMIVVLLVGMSVVGSMAQAVDGRRAVEAKGEVVYSAALYAGIMAVIAAVMA